MVFSRYWLSLLSPCYDSDFNACMFPLNKSDQKVNLKKKKGAKVLSRVAFVLLEEISFPFSIYNLETH